MSACSVEVVSHPGSAYEGGADRARTETGHFVGVSLPDLIAQKGVRGALQILISRPENQVCADCEAPGPEWAVINHGVFVCIACAGIHREMGTGISRVKSVKLDEWTADMLQALGDGNEQANAKFECFRPRFVHKPLPFDKTVYRRNFILSKYQLGEFTGQVGDADENGADESRPQMLRREYMKDELEIQLMKRGRHKDEWPLRNFKLSTKEKTVSYFKPAEGKDTLQGSLPIGVIDTLLLDSDTIGQPGSSTILQLTMPEMQQDGKTKKRNIFLKGSFNGRDLVQFYLAIRHAKIVLLSLSGSEEALNPFSQFGWAFKKGKQLKDEWRRRWFVLDGNELRYYENPLEALPLGSITIHSAKAGFKITDGVPLKSEDSASTFTLETPSRHYWVKVTIEADAEKWKAALQAVISAEDNKTE